MKAQITKITQRQSKFTGKPVYMVCFKCEDGKSRTAWIDSGYGNYSRWQHYLTVGMSLDGLNVKSTGIDADSYPKECK